MEQAQQVQAADQAQEEYQGDEQQEQAGPVPISVLQVKR